MRLNRSLKVGFALFLALMLPLRTFAATAHCEPHPPAHAPHAAHAAPAAHCAQQTVVLHAHGCGDCCCVAAMALVPARWVIPHISSPGISAQPTWPPPSLAHDRLDRPPRLPA